MKNDDSTANDYCYSMTKSSNSFWDYALAGVLTGTTVMVTQGLLEGMFRFGLGGNSMIVRLIINLVVSGLSGFVAILLVDATGLLDN